MKTINHNPIHRIKTLPLTLAALLVATAVSHATPTVSPTRSAWTVAVQNATTEPILTQSFNGTDTVDTDIPVATETFNVFGNFSVYYETFENVDKASYDYAFDSSTDRPLDIGIDIGGSDRTTALEFRFASPQIGFAADFASVDIGEGLILTLFNGTTPTGETVNFDAILTEEAGGDGFVGFTTDLPFTSFAFGPIIFGDDAVSSVFHLDEISTAEAGDGEEEEPSNELPFISSVSLSGGTFFCTLSSSIAGQSYQLQSNRDPSLNQWINIGDIVTGNGGPLDFQAPAPADDTENFYRVEVTTP